MDIERKAETKVEGAEMAFLRNVAGYTLKDQIINTVIRNELNVFNFNNIIQNNRLNWIHDGEKMEPERIPEQLMEQDPLDARSYAGRINPPYRGTERIERYKP
jgi:hypothetical protein